MMAQKIPSIRFPGFTEPWEQRKFGELALRASETESDPDLPHVEYEDIVPGQGTLNKNLAEKRSDKTGILFEPGDVLYGKLRPYLMNWLYPQFKGIAVGDFWVLRPLDIDGSFLYRLIQSPDFQSVTNVSAGSKMLRADWKLVSQREFAIPEDLAEQRKVGALFSRLDSLITLHQREHDRLIDVRTSLMQKMFPGPGEDTPKIRFSEFSGAWGVHKLGDLVTRYDHRVPTPNDGYTRLGVRSFARGTFLEKVPADQAIGETELREVGANNLIVNIVFAWEQAIAITSEPDTVALVSHRFPQFSFNEGQCPAFYRYALLDPRFKHHLWLASPSGAGRNKTLRIDEMLDYEILVPDESEQRAIARFFKNLDQSIEARRCECDALVHAKSALLRKMFV